MESTAKTRETLQSLAMSASEVMAVMAVTQVRAQPNGGAAVAGDCTCSPESAIADADKRVTTGNGKEQEDGGEDGEQDQYQTASEGE